MESLLPDANLKVSLQCSQVPDQVEAVCQWSVMIATHGTMSSRWCSHMIAKVRVRVQGGKRQSYLLRAGCLGPGQHRWTVLGKGAGLGGCCFPAPDNHRDGPLAGPVDG